jgi:quinolinate synthase
MGSEQEIRRFAKEKNAIILAHNYQIGEIQDIADFGGDSLELARKAAKNDADIIVFCGVHFMAESAAMLSPQKKVILPEESAGCPMADMIDVEDVIQLRQDHPDATVVTYINSSAAVKAESDVVCTSSNAQKIVERIDGDKIIFLPDKNLGHYVQRFTKKEIIIAEGFCPTHDRFTKEEMIKIKKEHPDAVTMVHPECKPEVVDLADNVLSTGQMVKFVNETNDKKIIIGTEIGMIHRLKKEAPHIEYIPASDSFICPNMKKISLAVLLRALKNEETVITVEDQIAEKAKKTLDKMLELSY